MAKIIKVEQTVPTIKTKKKVAAYARVSMESERMNHSLSAQISYYSTLIQKNPDWQYAGVFADDGISGTSIEKRDEFKRMVISISFLQNRFSGLRAIQWICWRRYGI